MLTTMSVHVGNNTLCECESVHHWSNIVFSMTKVHTVTLQFRKERKKETSKNQKLYFFLEKQENIGGLNYVFRLDSTDIFRIKVYYT